MMTKYNALKKIATSQKSYKYWERYLEFVENQKSLFDILGDCTVLAFFCHLCLLTNACMSVFNNYGINCLFSLRISVISFYLEPFRLTPTICTKGTSNDKSLIVFYFIVDIHIAL